MPLPDPVGSSYCPFNSGCGDADRNKFICSVEGHNTEDYEVWILGEDGVTPKVHTTLRVDVDATDVYEFSTNNLTDYGLKTSIFSKKWINGRFKFLDVPDPLTTIGTYWFDNILVTIPAWVVGGTVKILNWRIQPGGCYGNVFVPWIGVVPACPDYLYRSSVKYV